MCRHTFYRNWHFYFKSVLFSLLGAVYLVTPQTHCLDVYKLDNKKKNRHLYQWKCGAGTAFDLSLCACNHWFFIDVDGDCKSSWYSWSS